MAVLAVVLYHAGVPVLRGGYVGVDVFFVISGFLITQLLWRELAADGRIALSRFYARRARRLLPAAALVLGVSLGATYLLLPPLRVADAARDAAAAAVYSANYRFAVHGTDYLGSTGPPSPFQHFWSLGVEEQFYLVFPVLLMLAVFFRRAVRISRQATAAGLAALGLLSLLLSLHLTATNEPWAFYSLPTRAWELAAGGTLALCLPEVRRLSSRLGAVLGWAGVAALLAAAVGFGARTPYPGVAALLPVTATAALLASGATSGSSTGPARLLRQRPLQGIGAVSYSWYLWHWPVLVLGALLWPGPGARTVLVVLSAGLAALTYAFVEDPIRGARTLVRSPARSLALGGGLTAAALVLALLAADLAPAVQGSAAPAITPRLAPVTAGPSTRTRAANRLSSVERPVLAATAQAVLTRAVPSNLSPALTQAHADKALPFLDGCDLGFTAAVSPPCGYGDAAGRSRIVAFGDSHAAQWFPALEAAALAQHWRLEDLTKATCPPFSLRISSPVLGREFRECEQWRVAALGRILREKPSLVIVDVARHYGSEYGFTVDGPPWIQALGALVTRLRSAGIPVLVLGPTPKPPGDVPDCLSRHLHSVPDCTDRASAEVDQPGAARERAAVTAAGGSYLPVAPWICTRDRCAVVIGNLLVFRDDNHVSTSFARWLTPVFTVAVQDLVGEPGPNLGRPVGRTPSPSVNTATRRQSASGRAVGPRLPPPGPGPQRPAGIR